MPSSSDNKRIAVNTIIIYIKIIVTVVIGLVSARFVLQALGASDYGLYNVVGSIIGLYGFIAGSLTSTTVRYLNYEMGKKDGDVNRMFNVCNVLHILMALLILVVSETIGIWYILNYLTVEPGKEADAMFVFQVSTIVSCIGIINVPYQSLFNVHENFLFPSVVEIVNALLKLFFILLLFVYSGNHLRFYALSMSLLTFLNFIIYHVTCYRRWGNIVRWKLVREVKAYKGIVNYNVLTFLQTMSTTLRNSGSNVLINMFFGTITNAAYAISSTIQTYVVTFTSTFDNASAPQITQNVSSGDMERAQSLAKNICRICILLCLFISMPLFVEIDFILKLWLGTPPEGTALFCRLVLVITLVSATSAGMFQMINAIGKILWFRISISVLYCSCIPIGYILYKMGAPSYTILVLFIIADILLRCVHYILMSTILDIKVLPFIRAAYLRPAIVLCLMSVFVVLEQELAVSQAWLHLCNLLLCFLVGAVLVFFIGLKERERDFAMNTVKNRWMTLRQRF